MMIRLMTRNKNGSTRIGEAVFTIISLHSLSRKSFPLVFYKRPFYNTTVRSEERVTTWREISFI